MSQSLRSITVAVCLVMLVALGSRASAQSQATCKFNFFRVAPSDPNDPSNPGITRPLGVNDFGTVVGDTTPFNSQRTSGFIRFSGGGVSKFSAPNSIFTSIADRNNSGISIGNFVSQSSAAHSKGFVLTGSSFTSFTHPKSVQGTILNGINKFNSIVGFYLDGSSVAHGFKKIGNTFLPIQFPGSQGTSPRSINDLGTIVGSYTKSSGGDHGFIFHNNQWATLDLPNSQGTVLYGISNAGLVIGIRENPLDNRSFLFSNGVTKFINAPNASSTQISGISAGGIITGEALFSDGWSGFTATCK